MVTNDKGNILCRNTKTNKLLHLHPSFVNNETLMRTKGWNIVEEPQAPPPVEEKEPEVVVINDAPPIKRRGRPKKV